MTVPSLDGWLARVERLWHKSYRTEVSESVRRAVSFIVVAGAVKALLEQMVFGMIVVSLGCLIWIADQYFEVCDGTETDDHSLGN